jgi:hypothetical protein
VAHGDERGPFDARVWRALGTAARRSRWTGAPRLSAAPVLLALLEPRRGPARRLLRALDVDHAALRRRAGELARPPRATADPGSLVATPALVAALAAAERERLLAGAPHLTVTLLLAGLAAEGGELVEPLAAAGASARLDAVLAELGPLVRPLLGPRPGARTPAGPWRPWRRGGDPVAAEPAAREAIAALGPAAEAIAADLETSRLPARPPREAAAISLALRRPPAAGPERLPPPVRVENGRVVLDATAWRGGGELRIRNGTDLDAVTVLTTLAGRPVRAVAVRSGHSAAMRHVADGPYLLYFTLGLDWDASRRRFADPSTCHRFTEPLVFRTTGSLLRGDPTFPAYEVTLHPVERGSAPVQPVPEAEFPSLR